MGQVGGSWHLLTCGSVLAVACIQGDGTAQTLDPRDTRTFQDTRQQDTRPATAPIPPDASERLKSLTERATKTEGTEVPADAAQPPSSSPKSREDDRPSSRKE